MSDADAKRFGGGSSFGGRSSYSAPYNARQLRRLVPPVNNKRLRQTRRPNQAGQPWRFNGHVRRFGIGWIARLDVHWRRFYDINFMDILIFGGIAFLLYKLFAAKKAGSAQRPAYNRTADNGYQDTASTYHQHQEPQSNQAIQQVLTPTSCSKKIKTIPSRLSPMLNLFNRRLISMKCSHSQRLRSTGFPWRR